MNELREEKKMKTKKKTKQIDKDTSLYNDCVIVVLLNITIIITFLFRFVFSVARFYSLYILIYHSTKLQIKY